MSVESGGPSCPHSQNETTSRVDDIADWINQTTGTSNAVTKPRGNSR
ncbi:hypothetical protein [Micromonospora sp. NPDC005173]